MTLEHHTEAHWATRPRALKPITIDRVDDHGDSVAVHCDDGWVFDRSKTDLGRDIHPGDRFVLETIGFSQITGLLDVGGAWLFRLSNADLAAQAREHTEAMHRSNVVTLETNKQLWAQHEAELPDWLQARIKRFRDAAGERFLLEGWGYELLVCRLAALLAAGDEAGAEQLASTDGATGNQWGCAKVLAEHQDQAAAIPAALSPLTGSADYS